MISGKKNKYKNILFICLTIALICGAILISVYYREKDSSYVATVNGEQISVKEFKLILNNKIKKDVITEFSTKFIDANDKNFWENNYDGQIPGVIVKQRTLNDVVKIKLQQILAQKYGLLNDISYKSFLENLKKENLRRQNAVKNNEVIYGLEKYDEYGYYDYVMTNMVTAVKNKFWEKEYKDKVSDDELRQLYEKTKDKFYTKPLNIKIERIFIDFANNIEVNNSVLEKAKKVMYEIKTRVDKGESFEVVYKSFEGVGGIKAEYTQQALDASYYRAEGKLGGSIYRQSSSLSSGETSEVFESRGAEIIDDKIVNRRTLNIVRCLEKEGTEMGYQSFEEARQAVMARFNDAKYNEMMDKLNNEAKVVLNEPVYDRIKFK